MCQAHFLAPYHSLALISILKAGTLWNKTNGGENSCENIEGGGICLPFNKKKLEMEVFPCCGFGQCLY